MSHKIIDDTVKIQIKTNPNKIGLYKHTFSYIQIYDRVISIVIGKNILCITYLSICVSAIRSLKFLISPTFCEKKNESSYGVEYTLLTANCTQRDVMTLKLAPRYVE